MARTYVCDTYDKGSSPFCNQRALLVELVDTVDLESTFEKSVGSNPTLGKI